MDSYKSRLPEYWKRRGYHRVGREQDPSRRRRFWRIKIPSRLVFLRLRKAASPRRFLKRIRDGYVRFMLGLSDTVPVGIGYGFGGYGFGRDDHEMRFAAQKAKEYDEKVLIEIYKSLVAASVPTAAAAAVAVRR
ncbi:uncharacterized protein LOC122050379 [Zingiber officinale]|uniref:Uncharacterized protein n=1 Tax=Zingiber officinale TaxID=94328 RepID=A0A8J5H5I0_ZINOF|nr:uncharacterized protein LOC122050379 [Zingiber officinale]KAG6520940.1 hypothetical protein ZIOFF_018004 [Zingiber officinale]